MLTKTITAIDFNGEERTEKFHFNLTEAELLDWELSVKGTLSEHIERIKETIDIPELTKLYRELIDRSYGVKDADGRRFRKTPELLQEFKDTAFYSELYMELATNQAAGGEFLAGIVSDKLKTVMEQKGVLNGTGGVQAPAVVE